MSQRRLFPSAPNTFAPQPCAGQPVQVWLLAIWLILYCTTRFLLWTASSSLCRPYTPCKRDYSFPEDPELPSETACAQWLPIRREQEQFRARVTTHSVIPCCLAVIFMSSRLRFRKVYRCPHRFGRGPGYRDGALRHGRGLCGRVSVGRLRALAG